MNTVPQSLGHTLHNATILHRAQWHKCAEEPESIGPCVIGAALEVLVD